MPANGQGDILIGHAQFSASTQPSAGYYLIPRTAISSGAIYAAGRNTNVKRFAGNRKRWGDYSATQPDPADPMRFWTIPEYAAMVADGWAIRAAQITPPP